MTGRYRTLREAIADSEGPFSFELTQGAAVEGDGSVPALTVERDEGHPCRCMLQVMTVAASGRRYVVERLVACTTLGEHEVYRRVTEINAADGSELVGACPRCLRPVQPDGPNCRIVNGVAYHVLCAPPEEEEDHGSVPVAED